MTTRRRLSKPELDELNAIVEERGALTQEAIVERAMAPSSPLHRRFTWDETEAARRWRLEEARQLIMHVRVQMVPRPNAAPISVRAFVSLHGDRVDGHGYRPISTVLESGDLRAQLLETALDELQSVERRYKHLTELANVFAEVNKVSAKRSKKKSA